MQEVGDSLAVEFNNPRLPGEFTWVNKTYSFNTKTNGACGLKRSRPRSVHHDQDTNRRNRESRQRTRIDGGAYYRVQPKDGRSIRCMLVRSINRTEEYERGIRQRRVGTKNCHQAGGNGNDGENNKQPGPREPSKPLLTRTSALHAHPVEC